MQVAPSGEKRGAQTDPGMGENSIVRPGDRLRSYALQWVQNVAEGDPDPVVPPTYIVRYPDLLNKSWGWKRLVAYCSIQVEWSDYKKYLEDYYSRNAGEVASLCAKQEPETVGEGVAAKYNDLHAAAKLCTKLERKLLRHCQHNLTPEDIQLSRDIKSHAKLLIGSEVESSVAAAGMVCIAKEADLIYELLTSCSDWDTTELIASGSQIRRSALNLVKVSESAAVAGAMLGLAIEAKIFRQYLLPEGHFVSGYDDSCLIRECTVALLTKLEGELAQETAGVNGTPADDEKKSKLEKKRKKLEKKDKRLQKKMKLNGGNETKFHTGATAAVTEELEAEGQPGGEFLEDREVFVGNLPSSVNEAQLTELFKQAGSVEIAKIIYDKSTGTSRGFGFVSMSSVEEVKAAVEKFNGCVLDGRRLRVDTSSQGGPRGDANRVFVSNLPWSVDNSALANLFRGQGKVLEASIAYDRESGRSKGFGFVTYGSAEEVSKAISNLDGANVKGRQIRVMVADPKPRRRQY